MMWTSLLLKSGGLGRRPIVASVVAAAPTGRTVAAAAAVSTHCFTPTRRSKSTTSTTSRTSSSSQSSSSSFDSIPIPSGNWPLLGHLPRLIKGGDSIVNWRSMHEECGDIFRCVLPDKDVIVTKSIQHAKEILRNQGRYPVRTPMRSWEAVFDEHGWPAGIPFATGEEWKRRRKVLGETLLMAKNAKEYLGVVVPIANRYVDCLAGHLNPHTHRLDDDDHHDKNKKTQGTSFRQLIGMFALEAVLKVVVGVDFRGLTVPLAAEGVSFQRAIERMFAATKDCEDMHFWHVRFKTSRYRELKEAWEEMYSYPQTALRPVLEHYQQHGTLPEHTHGTVLPKLIADFEARLIDWDDVVGIGAQATAAAVDTTSQTAEYVLYNLATNPRVQSKLADSLKETVGWDGPLQMTAEQYDAQQYLFAVIRESMRHTPTIGVHARTLVRDANLGDYHVPAGKLVLINYMAMSHNDKLYSHPHVFAPERFLKKQDNDDDDDEESSVGGGCPHAAREQQATVDSSSSEEEEKEWTVHDPYAAIPFGHGARKCAGKGFAELDLHLAIAALVRKFEIKYDGPPLTQVEHQLLRPAEPLSRHFQFVPRQ